MQEMRAEIKNMQDGLERLCQRSAGECACMHAIWVREAHSLHGVVQAQDGWYIQACTSPAGDLPA